MRRVAVLGGLLAVSLIASYLTWTHEPEEVDDDLTVAVYVADEADLQRVSFSQVLRTVEVEPRTDDEGRYFWVTLTETKSGSKPDHHGHAHEDKPEEGGEKPEEGKPEEGGEKPEEGTPVAPSEAPEPAKSQTYEKVQAYLGGPRAEELWKALSPMMALRKLDSSTAQGVDFGMEDPHATMEITRKSGTLSLTLGEKTFGGRQRYLRVGENDYFLMNRDAFSNLEAPLRLMERRLYPLKAEKIDRVEVTQGEVSQAFVHQNKDDQSNAYWASADTPDKSNQVAQPWLTKLFRLIADGYVEESESNLTPVLHYTVIERRESYKVEIVKTDEGEYWARTTFNKVLVRLDQEQAEDIVNDLATVLAPAQEEEQEEGDKEPAQPQ